MEKNKKYGLILLVIYAFIALYLIPIFPHGGSANELTRWATAVSLVEKGSFEYSWTEPLVGQIVDSSKVGDKTYSNKAPATAIFSTPFYAFLRLFIDQPNSSNIRLSWNILRITTVSLPFFLLAFWLWKKETDVFSLAILLFATPLFSYSLVYFSHVFTAIFIYVAFLLLFAGDDEKGFGKLTVFQKTPILKYFVAGFLSGVAVLSEFPAAIVVVVFGIFLALDKSAEKLKQAGFFILGGLPCLIFLLIYNNLLFGSPFSFSYGNEAFGEWAEVAGQGILGVSFPTPEKIWTSFFSPSRGLFFYSPILIVAIFLFFTSKKRTEIRHRVALWASLTTLIILAGHGAPHGGWGMSARYGLLVLPLILDCFIRGEKVFNEFWKGLLLTISVLLCALPILTFPFAPPEFSFPHNEFWGHFLFSEAWFVPTIFGGSFPAILPVILALATVIGVCLWHSENRRNFIIGTVIAVLLLTIYIFPTFVSDENEFRRATIAERFFKPDGRLEVFREEAKKNNDFTTLQKINSFEWLIADTRAFAPNDFPYLANRTLPNSPSANLKKVLTLQKQGKIAEAEQILQKGKEEFPFARCEYSTNLAVVFYSTNRKEQALKELENVQSLVTKASRPDCWRSQFLLGSLYFELNRTDEAKKVLSNFLLNTEKATDKQTLAEKQQAKNLLSK